STMPHALETTERIARLQRALGKRTEAADTYGRLMTIWERSSITSKSMGQSALDLAFRRIDATLWASRYRAMIGDYESGKIHAQKALDLIADAYGSQSRLSAKDKAKLAILRAEGYH